MKKIFSLLLCILMLVTMLSFVSCGEDETPSGMQKVDTSYLDCKFYVPDTFIIDSTANSSMQTPSGFVAASDTKGRNYSLSRFSPEGNYESIDDYYKSYYIKTLKDTFNNVELLEEYLENQTLGSTPAVKYVLLVTVGEEKYRIEQIMTGHSYYLYLITYTAKDADFDSGIENFEKIVEAFKFN